MTAILIFFYSIALLFDFRLEGVEKMSIQEINYRNSVEYVWLLIDKFDSREITESEFVHNIIQEWMMEVPRDEVTA